MNDKVEPKPAKPKVTILDTQVKVQDHAVRSDYGGGWSASEVLKVDNGMEEEVIEAGGVSVLQAVKDDRAERGVQGQSPRNPNIPLTALGQPFAIYRHPSEFTEEEEAVIINGLLAQLPLYMIADKLKCSRTTLSNHIKESKLLSQVVVDRNESFIDNVEWQAKRLIDSGNPAMIMFALQTKGKERGWGQNPMSETEMDDTRIVIGEIPDDEVAAAERKVKEIEAETEKEMGGGADVSEGRQKARASVSDVVGTAGGVGVGGGKVPSPMEMALMEDAAKRAAEDVQRERDANTVEVAAEDVQVGPAPWDDGYGGGGGGGYPFGGDGGVGFGDGGFEGFM